MIYANPVIVNCGLGNKLFVWARAEIFAARQNVRMLYPCLFQFPSLGAIFRGERYLRTNAGNFKLSCGGYVGRLRSWWLRYSSRSINEYDWTPVFTGGLVNFVGMGRDSFQDVLRNHDLISERLKTITHPSILRAVDELARAPFIDVHIRRGDFKQAGVKTEDAWYIAAIQKAIESVGHLPIRVFSDGKLEELDFVRKALPNEQVIIMPAAKPMQDIWALSKSKIMVGSSRSSFSIWAVLLGQMPSIWARKNAPSARDLYVDAEMKPMVVLEKCAAKM